MTDPAVPAERYRAVPRTLCFLRLGQRWLLLRRAADRKLWPNLYNGIGGHIEVGEGIVEATRREVREEAGIEARELRLVGVIHSAERGLGVALFVFSGIAATPDVRESPEGTPVWVTVDQALKLPLLPDLYLILPRLLARRTEDPPFVARSMLDEAGMPLLVFEEG